MGDGLFVNSLYGLETRPLQFVASSEGKVLLTNDEVSVRYLKKNFPTLTFPTVVVSTGYTGLGQTDWYHSNNRIMCIDVTGSLTGNEKNNLTQDDFN